MQHLQNGHSKHPKVGHHRPASEGGVSPAGRMRPDNVYWRREAKHKFMNCSAIETSSSLETFLSAGVLGS